MTTSVSTIPIELSEAMQEKRIWQPMCPIALERLALVKVKYHDFDGTTHDDGELIVHDAVASRVERVFSKLFEMRFPIARIKSLHHFDGDDEKSMAANNTSCFNFRQIQGSASVSMHGYGLAIDVNPLQNPFVTFDETNGIATIHPPNGWQFLNRHNQKTGMVEPIVSLFEENGFIVWGGGWTTPIDYHHFQPPRLVAELLAAMNREDGIRFFETCAENHKQVAQLPGKTSAEELVALYQTDGKGFFDRLARLVE